MSLFDKIINMGSNKRYEKFLSEYKSFTEDELLEWYKGLRADIDFGTNTKHDRTMLNVIENEIRNRKTAIC